MSEYKILKKIGIWMDHSHAHLIEYSDHINQTDDIIIKTSYHSNGDNENDQNESMVHNKEQQDQSKYYKKLSDRILSYNKVLLFGPTDAKTELLKLLKADHHFDQVEIEVKSVDKMTENQKKAFVNDYFSSSSIEN